jgi:hypothetical protein
VIDTDTPSQHSAGTESKRGYHALERTYYPVYQTSRVASAVSPELWRSGSPPKHSPVDTSIQIQRPQTTAQFDSSPFPLPPTIRGSPIPPHASDHSPLHFGYNASSGADYLISERHPQPVAMSTLTGHAQYGGGVIDAHMCHYDPSFGFGHDTYMIEHPRALPSPTIPMPMVPAYLNVGASGCVDPLLASDPTLRWPPHYATPAYQHVPPPDSTPSLSPPGNFDSESSSSPSPPLSTGNHGLIALSPPEMLDQIQPQPITTTSTSQLYTFTISLQNIEFPPVFNAGDMQFFQCTWQNCGIWITSDKEAVKDHLTRAHSVVFKGNSTESACCEWNGCSTSLQTCGLARHFQTHLSLQWLCSVCKGPYTRPDSVTYHAHRQPRCKLAQAISVPSPMAFRARINGDATVTLTKILQP